MQFAIPRPWVSVARPPEPEPYSWVAPLDSPTQAIRIPDQRDLARRAAARQGRSDDRSTADEQHHSYDPSQFTRNP
ncbi:hypothetical protein GCM10018980_30170 [Streptomyces capoamus]|uniref:Uncharacterized protein n=2 Tax=Streptomyces TaxID=1883 RepID=A0A919EVC7_9ACTN|nr:hypothetical protein GCM10018980_30170 [Streptomyces capoamus]